jgi:hypothetical protein
MGDMVLEVPTGTYPNSNSYTLRSDLIRYDHFKSVTNLHNSYVIVISGRKLNRCRTPSGIITSILQIAIDGDILPRGAGIRSEV